MLVICSASQTKEQASVTFRSLSDLLNADPLDARYDGSNAADAARLASALDGRAHDELFLLELWWVIENRELGVLGFPGIEVRG